MTKKRLVWLDALKGIGILSIMRVHMVAPMEYLQSLLYVGAVSMFFIAAGFNYKNPDNIKRSLKQKAERLLIPYFFWSLSLLVVEHDFSMNSLRYIVGILYARMSIVPDGSSLLVIGNAPMWFLPCMFLSYVWMYMIYSRANTKRNKVFTIIGFIVMSMCLHYLPILLPWSLDTSFLCAALMAIGYEGRQYFMNGKGLPAIVFIILWVFLLPYFGGSNISIAYYGQYGVASILMFAFIAICETYSLSFITQKVQGLWVSKALAYIGRQSLRLMCIHLIIYLKVYGFLNAHFPEACANKWLLLATAFTTILAINAIIDYCINKLKAKVQIVKFL